MRLEVNKKVNACYERAAVCRMNAERASDHGSRAAYQRIEASWIKLAHSFELAEQAGSVTVEAVIGSLVFRCPTSGHDLDAGLQTSYESIAAAAARTIRLHCPHCDSEHPIPLRDGLIRVDAP